MSEMLEPTGAKKKLRKDYVYKILTERQPCIFCNTMLGTGQTDILSIITEVDNDPKYGCLSHFMPIIKLLGASYHDIKQLRSFIKRPPDIDDVCHYLIGNKRSSIPKKGPADDSVIEGINLITSIYQDEFGRDLQQKVVDKWEKYIRRITREGAPYCHQFDPGANPLPIDPTLIQNFRKTA